MSHRSLDIKQPWEADHERRVRWTASNKSISTSHQSHPRKEKEKINFQSAVPFSGIIATIIYRKRMSVRQEVTCTYLHHTKPHILSPCLSASLSFERQAAHRPHCAHEAAAERYHLPDMGQQKPKPYGYIWQRLVNHTEPHWHTGFHGLIYEGIKEVDFVRDLIRSGATWRKREGQFNDAAVGLFSFSSSMKN